MTDSDKLNCFVDAFLGILDKIAYTNKVLVDKLASPMTTNPAQQPAPPPMQPIKSDENQSLIQALMPLFMNCKDYVMAFLNEIEGTTPLGLTQIVNRYVKENKLYDWARKSPLWKVLYTYGLYKLTESNWNRRVI